jgi:hypothetical protein
MPTDRRLPQFSLKGLLLTVVFVAVGTLLGKWLLVSVPAQLILALLSLIALAALAGYAMGCGIGYAYGNSQHGGVIGAMITLLIVCAAFGYLLILPT